MGENRLVQSFLMSVRTLNPTYEYGVDYQLGDTITAIDERLGITTDAVVQAVMHTVSKDGESLTPTFGYGQPSIFDILKRKADK